jgi:hypothetical protein
VSRRDRRGWKVLLGVAVVAPVLAVVALSPALAAGDQGAAVAHQHGAHPDFDSDIDPDQPVLIEFWVLGLQGKPVVVEARQEGRPETAMVDQLDQVRESLTFGIRQ